MAYFNIYWIVVMYAPAPAHACLQHALHNLLPAVIFQHARGYTQLPAHLVVLQPCNSCCVSVLLVQSVRACYTLHRCVLWSAYIVNCAT